MAGAEFALGYLGAARNLPGLLRDRVRPGSHDRDTLDDIRHPERLVSHGPRRMTKTVLFPVRFLFTAATGRVGSNVLAAEHYLASAGAPAAELVAAAVAWRLEPPAGETATALLRRELIPLYVYYLDDHVARLSVAGRPALADRFSRCRARLLA